MEEIINTDEIINTEQHNCTICLNENINTNLICSTNCSHIFCKDCFDTWLDRGQQSCPLCRQKIQYFKNNNINYRILIPGNSRNGGEMNREGGRNTISSEAVRNIIRQNYNMRYILFIMFLLMIAGYNYYTILSNEYNKLSYLYVTEKRNITLLHDKLINCYSHGEKEIQVDIWDGVNTLKKCFITATSYFRCFQE